MALYIITVKLPKNPSHDGRNKKSGMCPINNAICTDVTGEHHSYIQEADSPEDALEIAKGKYDRITRVEGRGW